MFKQKIKDTIYKNSYFCNWVFSHYKVNQEKYVSKKSLELSNVDSLQNTEILEKYLKDIKSNNKPFWSYDINATEQRLYGIHNSLFPNIQDINILFPAAEHGLILHNSNWTDTSSTARASVITFGDFRKHILNRYYDRPIFCVGPYIHYARDYYSSEIMIEKKKELGKTLLVFPTHSTDDSTISYSERIFVDKILSLKSHYDSILINVFWWNLDSKLTKLLQKEGCHILSAGYREDPNFLSRLKAAIDLSDFVIGDSVGTHIGYCLERGKVFSLFDADTVREDMNANTEDAVFVQEQEKIIHDAFLNIDTIEDEQKQIYDYYWGGNKIKSNEELIAIYNINKKITIRAHGFTNLYGEYANEVLEEFSNSNALLYNLLKEALN